MSLSFLPFARLAALAALLFTAVHPLAAAETCETYSTCIAWNKSPHGAAVEATERDKLLLVLHLSGNFTKTEFT